jgi:putative tryptophan/tyrosine transport system substrate-binding protein
MRRRDFVTLLGGAATWPLAARAQQPVMAVVGFLHPGSPEESASLLAPFRKGLAEAGYAEGRNLAIEYRWAENQIDRLATLATELVQRRVAVIAAVGGILPALAAKAATTTIPIVFDVGDDPVKLGLVASLARPGGNLTGINFRTIELAAKRLELIRELVPAATRVAVLVNPRASAETELSDVGAAARPMGLQIRVVNASTSLEIDAAFVEFKREQPHALFVGTGTFFRSRRVQIVLLATRYAIPAMYSLRDYAEVGGLMSYGADLMDVYRQVGVYAGRILKGTKPLDLPVEQPSKFQFVINLPAARAVGLDVPAGLLALADEVIE